MRTKPMAVPDWNRMHRIEAARRLGPGQLVCQNSNCSHRIPYGREDAAEYERLKAWPRCCHLLMKPVPDPEKAR